MKKIIIHCTGGTNADPLADTSHHTAKQVNNWHKQRFNMPSKSGMYMGYNYFIENDGKITQAREVGEEGAHTKGYNHNVAICLAGNFDRPIDSPNSMPTLDQMRSLRSLYQQLQRDHDVEKRIYLHNEFASKTCPGKNLRRSTLQKLLETPPQQINVHFVLYQSGISSTETDAIRTAINFVSDNTLGIVNIRPEIAVVDNDPVSIHWRDKVVKRSWYDLYVTPYTKDDTDIVMFMVPHKYWLPIKSRYAYIHHDKRLGRYVAAQMMRPNWSRNRNGDLFGGNQIAGSLTHELLHAMYFAKRARLTGFDDTVYDITNDNTHFLDFRADHLDMRHGFLWGVDPTRLPKRDENLLFKYVGEFTTVEKPLHQQHIKEGRAYRTRDSNHFFKYTIDGWQIVSEETYTDTENRMIFSDSNARWLYNLLETIPAPRRASYTGIKSKKYRNTFQKLWLLANGWKTTIPKKHLNM